MPELAYSLQNSANKRYDDILNATVNRQNSCGCDWREAVILLAIAMQEEEDCPGENKKKPSTSELSIELPVYKK